MGLGCVARVGAVLAAGIVLGGSGAVRAADGFEPGWQFEAYIYGWLPGVDASADFKNLGSGRLAGGGVPGDSVSVDLDASFDDILDSLDFVFMGSLGARHGRWSVLTDLIYLKLSDDKGTTTVPLVPGGPGVRVDVGTDLKATVWTLAGGYTVVARPEVNLDLIAGFRYLRMDLTADLAIDGPLQTLPSRSLSADPSNWDALVGVKGAVRPGGSWFLPYYADVGTGDSELTWQLLAGVGYRFEWGDVVLAYRHLDYELEGDKLDLDIGFSGPALGVGFRF